MQTTGGKKANITAAFGSDIVLEGNTGVPNLLLKYYSKLGITETEMMLIIQLIYLRNTALKKFPSDSDLAEIMTGERTKIKADIASLIEKGILGITQCYCEESDEIVATYTFEPLFEKISEIWACEKVKNYQQMKKALKQQKQKEVPSDSLEKKQPFAKVCKAFEKEFARLLSPMEIEQISAWIDDFQGSTELILEALKRAVLLGKHNFKYIDSILLEWHKNNLKTLTEVQTYESNFRERQAKQSRRKIVETNAKKRDKFWYLYSS